MSFQHKIYLQVNDNNTNVCTYYQTNEYSYSEIEQVFYTPTGDETLCVFESNITLNYSIKDDILTTNNTDIEIINLTIDELKLKRNDNSSTIILTFERIN